jgi:hypothetical protein
MQQMGASCGKCWRSKALAALWASCPQSYPQKMPEIAKAVKNHRVREWM